MMTATFATTLQQRVSEFYEAYPYPRYPLLLPLRWQDGYLAYSGFAGRLRQGLTGEPSAIHQAKQRQLAGFHTVLVAGCGETLPFIIRRQEPASHRLLCIDLSRRSLQRARIRSLLTLKSAQFVRSDISDYLRQQGKITGPYDHIDIYGVLHHTANPSEILRQIAERLHPQGTVRLMVYNQSARRWIQHIQKAFRLLGLDPLNEHDLALGRTLLQDLKQVSRPIAARLRAMGPSYLSCKERFADCFFNVRETSLSVTQWFKSFAEAGLTPIGLLDRYAELDDLRNPLWTTPLVQHLQERADDYRFENNLEVFLARDDHFQRHPANELQDVPSPVAKWRTFLKSLSRPPRIWFQFEETKNVSFALQQRLWSEHLNFMHGRVSPMDDLLERIHPGTRQRLARLGAILPGQVTSTLLLDELNSPMAAYMERPRYDAPQELAGTSFSRLLVEVLQQRGRYSEANFFALIKRFHASQS